MESDTIRTIGGKTVVDMWLDGRMRGISVTRDAIESHVGGAGMSDDQRSEFVRANLPLVMAAARRRLKETGADSDSVIIDQLGASSTNRRKVQRRQGERRKADRPEAIPPTGDRRRAQRRKGDRRARTEAPAKD
jgi:hypothetical protein